MPSLNVSEYGRGSCRDPCLIAEEASKRMAALTFAHSSVVTGLLGSDGCPSRLPWGRHVVDFMAGRTLASKLSLTALYSASVLYLGWQEPLAWVQLLTAVLGLHVLLPRLYKTHYLYPPESVCDLAANHRPSLSSALRITDRDQLLFEKMAAAGASCGWVKDMLMLVGLLSMYSIPCVLLLVANGYAMCSPAPVVLGSLVFVPLRTQASARGHLSRRQCLNLATEVYCWVVNWAPFLADSFQTRHVGSGFSAVAAGAHGIFLALRTLTKATVLEKPVRCCIRTEAATALCAFLVVPLASGELGQAGGLPALAYQLVPHAWSSAVLVAALVSVARRAAKSEAGYLQAFLDRNPEQHHSNLCRPRLGLVCKFPNATPADLPHDLRQQMLQLVKVEVESLDGFIRPGCLLLSLNYRFGNDGTHILEAGRNAVLESLRNIAVAAGLPWAELDAVVCVADTRFTVKGGVVVKEEAVLSPVIVTVDRLAIFGAETLTLKALGLGKAPFSVVLRTASDYVDLTVVSEEDPDDNTKLLTVRLPEARKPGMAWLELHSHASLECPTISEGFPVMFSPSKCLAEELSKTLLHKLPTIQHVSSLLEDVATYLCEDSAPSMEQASDVRKAALLREVVRLELPECFSLLAQHRDLCKAAVSVPPGLLTAAVKSQSPIMLIMVVTALHVHSLAFEPCQIPEGSTDGFSPLHLAATYGTPSIIATLLDAMPDAELQWYTHQSGVCGKTPAEMMEVRWPWFSISALLRTLPSFRSRAVWGTDLVAALSFQSTAAMVAFPVAYSAMLAAIGWREPLAWLTVAALSFGLHMLVPWFHKDYVRRLARVREMAQSCELRVTQGLEIMDAEIQQAYEQGQLRQSSRHPMRTSLLFMATVLPAAVLPGLQSWEVLGEVELWTVVQAVVALAVLTLSRWFVVKAGWLGGRQLVDLTAWTYCVSMAHCHRIYVWASEKDTCSLPEELVDGVMKGQVALTYITAVMPFLVILFLVKMAVVSGPLCWLAWVEPLFVPADLYLLAYRADAWCFNLLTGGHLPATIPHASAVLWLVGSICCLGMRVRSEAVHLASFLSASLQEKSARW